MVYGAGYRFEPFEYVLPYIVVPMAISAVLRRWVLSQSGEARLQKLLLLLLLRPASLFALLATLVLLFRFQGQQILVQPAVIALPAVPILM